jgi:hypothetical protein
LVRLAAAGLRIALDGLAELIGEGLECDKREPELVLRKFEDLHTA